MYDTSTGGAQISPAGSERRLGQLRGAGSDQKLVGGVDHDVAALPHPDPAPELDLAPGLDAGYVRAPVEERGDLPGAVGDQAGEHAAVLHRPDLHAVDPAFHRDLAVLGGGDYGCDAGPRGRPLMITAVRRRDRALDLPDGLALMQYFDACLLVEGNDGGGGPRDPAHYPRDLVGGLVVHQPAEQRRVAPPRQDDGHVRVWVAGLPGDKLAGRPRHPPVGTFHQV